MDKAEYSTLLAALQDVSDPRQACGRRYSWELLLGLISGALASGQRTPHAMADWVRLHTVELREALHVARECLASEATLRRALRVIDLTQLEERLAQWAVSLAAETPTAGTIQTARGETLQGQAVDGKSLRGARAYESAPHLVSLV